MTGPAQVVDIRAGVVLALLDELEAWTADGFQQFVLLWPCTRCGAAMNEACRRPSGAPFRNRWRALHHAPRADLACRAFNTAPLRAWRADLLKYGIAPDVVRREIERSLFYRRLVKLGLLLEEATP